MVVHHCIMNVSRFLFFGVLLIACNMIVPSSTQQTLLVSDTELNNVYQVEYDGSNFATLSTSVISDNLGPVGMAIDFQRNQLLVAGGNHNEVATVSLANPSLPSIILPNSLPGSEHFQVAIDAANDRYFWTTDRSSGFPTRLGLFYAPLDGSGSATQVPTSALPESLHGLAFDPQTNFLYTGAVREARIDRIQPDGSAHSILYQGGIMGNVRGLTISPTTNSMYWCQFDPDFLIATIMKGSMDGLAPPTPLYNPLSGFLCHGIEVIGDDVFWTEFDRDSEISWIVKGKTDGSGAQIIYNGPGRFRDIISMFPPDDIDSDGIPDSIDECDNFVTTFENLNEAAVTVSAFNAAGQSFRPLCTGDLISLSVELDFIFVSGDVQVDIFLGDGWDANATGDIASFAADVSGDGLLQIPLPLVRVFAEQTYTVRLAVAVGESTSFTWIESATTYGDGDGYSASSVSDDAIEAQSVVAEDDYSLIVEYDPFYDTDSDGVRDDGDVCPTTFDPFQIDSDSDGRGDACPLPSQVLVAARDVNSIYAFPVDQSAGLSSVIPSVSNNGLAGLSLDASRNDLYVAGGASEQVYRLNLDDAIPTSVALANGVSNDEVWDVEVDPPNGRYFFTTNATPGLWKANSTSTSMPAVAVSSDDATFGVAYDPSTDFVYYTLIYSNEIVRIKSDGTSREVLYDSTDGVNGPRGIVVDAVNNKIFWAQHDWSSGNVMEGSMDGSVAAVVFATTVDNDYMPVFVGLFENELYWTEFSNLSGFFSWLRKKNYISQDPLTTNLIGVPGRLRGIEFIDAGNTQLPDSDGDGFNDIDDCAPNDPNVYPGAPVEPCNEVNEDCDDPSLADDDGGNPNAQCILSPPPVVLGSNGAATIGPSLIDDQSPEICPNSIELSVDVTSVSCSDVGNSVTVTLNVMNNRNGLSDSCQSAVQVLDGDQPHLLPPQVALTLSIDSVSKTAVFNPQIVFSSTTDNCPNSLVFSDAVIFDCSDVQQTPHSVTAVVTDGSNNSDVRSIDVYVTAAAGVCTDCNPDVQPPQLLCDRDVPVVMQDGAASIAAADVVSISENCAILSVALSRSSFTCADVGNGRVPIQVVVVDTAHLSSSCEASVILQDLDEDQDGYTTGGCNGRPYDCNDDNDIQNPSTKWYEDADGDGFGNPKQFVQQCEPPPHSSLLSTDCDDTQRQASPAQVEICFDDIDNNCNGECNDDVVDEGEEEDEDGEADDTDGKEEDEDEDTETDLESSEEDLDESQKEELNTVVTELAVLSNTAQISGENGNADGTSKDAVEVLEDATQNLSKLLQGDDAIPPSELNSEVVGALAGAVATVSSNAAVVSQASRETLASSVAALTSSVTSNPSLFASAVSSGAMQNIADAVSNLIQGGYGNTVFEESLGAIEQLLGNGYQGLSSEVQEIVINTSEFSYESNTFDSGSKKKRLMQQKKREDVDECDDVINVEDLLRIFDSETSPLAVSRVDYRSNVAFDSLSSTALLSKAQGADLRLLSGSLIDPSLYGGVMVSIPMTVEEIRRFVEEGETPQCVFFDYNTNTWSTEGLSFVRWGNNQDPKAFHKPRCIVCRTQHFSDFGALLTGGGGGGSGTGGGRGDGVNQQFQDPEFATIFAVSWFLILLIVIGAVIFVVLAYKVPSINELVLGKGLGNSKKKLAKVKAERRRVESFSAASDSYNLDSYDIPGETSADV